MCQGRSVLSSARAGSDEGKRAKGEKGRPSGAEGRAKKGSGVGCDYDIGVIEREVFQEYGRAFPRPSRQPETTRSSYARVGAPEVPAVIAD